MLTKKNAVRPSSKTKKSILVSPSVPFLWLHAFPSFRMLLEFAKKDLAPYKASYQWQATTRAGTLCGG